jgi:outer membrane murein-binding lipoprotein Lpp
LFPVLFFMRLRRGQSAFFTARSEAPPSQRALKTVPFPVKVEQLPVKVEQLPVKVEQLPVKVEQLLVKVEQLPVKVEQLPVKVEQLPVKVEQLLVKVEQLLVKDPVFLAGDSSTLLRSARKTGGRGLASRGKQGERLCPKGNTEKKANGLAGGAPKKRRGGRCLYVSFFFKAGIRGLCYLGRWKAVFSSSIWGLVMPVGSNPIALAAR